VNAPSDIIDAMVLATAEACNNAILHAGGTAFTVTVGLDAGLATIAVTDHGSGFQPPSELAMPAPQATGRRGLAMMEALVDTVELTSGARGTTVVLTHSLLPAPVVTGSVAT
jgi:anti-sigma regulatory factor (Ser/Thr protein kinase)